MNGRKTHFVLKNTQCTEDAVCVITKTMSSVATKKREK